MPVRSRQLLAFASLALVLAGAARGTSDIRFPATLTVEPRGGHYANDHRRLSVVLDLRGESNPASVTLAVPRQFALEPQREEGAPVGQAELYVRAASGSLVRYAGTISAAPTAVADRRCGSTEAASAWLIRASNNGTTVELPVAISTRGGVRLHVCPNVRLPLAAIALSLTDVTPPDAPGAYVWRAFVTPRSGPKAAYEVRAVVPVPHVLTVRGSHRPKTRSVVLSGTLTALGKPRVGAEIDIVRLDRTAYPLAFYDSWDAVERTTPRGAYRVVLAHVRTQGFVASTPAKVQRCVGPSLAPAGCRTATIAGTESTPITVSVP